MKGEEAQLDRIANLIEQLIAIQLYRGGAKQSDIAKNLDMSVGKVNSLVKGLKPRKD